jgi:hypothetical protein
MTSMETPRAWAKLEETVFFLDHLRREHDAAPASSAKAFGFYLSAFLNAAYSLTVVLKFEATHVQAAGRGAYNHWRSEFLGRLSADDGAVWSTLGKRRTAEVHTTGMEMLSEERPAGPSEDLPAAGLSHPQAFYRILSTWYPGQMNLPQWARAWRDAPLHQFEIDGERREVVQVCAAYVRLLRRFLDEFHASALARDARE